MLQLWARVNLGAISIKGYSASPKPSALLKQSVYFIALANKTLYIK